MCLCNNRLGLRVIKWLRAERVDFVALVVHPEGRAHYREEIIQESGLPSERVFEANSLRDEKTLQTIERLKPDLALSVLFGYILKAPFLSLFPEGVINLHPAYLPYNRGAYPNVWSIVEGTPAGAAMHYIDEGIDTGKIISRRRILVEPVDTGSSLYGKLEDCAFDLLVETWPLIASRNIHAIDQPAGGTYHVTRDVDEIDLIDPDRQYKAMDLINIIRARTFPPYKGAYFEADGRRVYLELNLSYDQSIGDFPPERKKDAFGIPE